MYKILLQLRWAIFVFILFIQPVKAQKKINGQRVTSIKEWTTTTEEGRILDHITLYGPDGKKTEELEYLANGLVKERITFEYNDEGKCVKETYYDGKKKLTKTMVYEFDDDGVKQVKKTYLPNGKLKSTKEYEYILK